MNSLSVKTVIEKNRIASDTAFLVTLDIQVIDPATNQPVEMIYLVRNNEDVDFNGNHYVATPFEIDIQRESGKVPTITLAITDFSRAIQARMQKYGGGVGSNVTVMVVNSDALDQPPEVVEYFEVIGAQASKYITSWTLGAESPLNMTFPRGRQLRDRCRYQYKSQECAYQGPLQTCDLSLKGPNGCQAHSNTINFGGLPGINATGMRYV